jgi:hypothetical protein
MPSLKIIEIPKNLVSLFNNKNQEISFHSKYKQTVNFKVNNKIIAFQDKKLPLTPYSIKLAKFNSNIDVKDVQALLNSNKEFKCTDLKFEKSVKTRKIFLSKNLNFFLKSRATKSQILSAIFIQKTKNPFSAIIIKPENNLHKFVGLGNGLTPAGDDFIIGYILGNYLLNKITLKFKKRLKRIINTENATNDISRQFLDAAIDGNFNEFIIELVSKIKDNKSILTSLSKISRIGASSGLDLLSGLYLSIK